MDTLDTITSRVETIMPDLAAQMLARRWQWMRRRGDADEPRT